MLKENSAHYDSLTCFVQLRRNHVFQNFGVDWHVWHRIIQTERHMQFTSTQRLVLECIDLPRRGASKVIWRSFRNFCPNLFSGLCDTISILSLHTFVHAMNSPEHQTKYSKTRTDCVISAPTL